jgi:septal ring factor EnvC (AmiA/AmiB activator)
MLVLFVVSIGYLQIEIMNTAKQLKEIEYERGITGDQFKKLESELSRKDDLLKKMELERSATEDQLKKIEELNTSIENLPDSPNTIFKRKCRNNERKPPIFERSWNGNSGIGRWFAE